MEHFVSTKYKSGAWGVFFFPTVGEHQPADLGYLADADTSTIPSVSMSVLSEI